MAQRQNFFLRFADAVSDKSGEQGTFLTAVALIAIWALTGPIFHFSDTWQLVINTSTTIITFLMVFIIQNTQSRDNHATQLKLDELIRAVKGAHNSLLNIEKMSDEELDRMKKKYAQLAEQALQDLERGKKDTGRPEVR